MTQYYVIDQLMGSGKTSAMIRHINNLHQDKRVIFVTPYLTEVERIMHNCSDKDFTQPSSEPSKMLSLKQLLSKGANIVTTHALFYRFDEEVRDLVRKHGNYILVVDEAPSLINDMKINLIDLEVLMKSGIVLVDDRTKSCKFKYEDYNGVFSDIKNMCDRNMLKYSTNTLIYEYDKSILESFQEVYIMSYMFQSQICCAYYQINNISYTNMYVRKENGEYYLTKEETQEPDSLDYAELINIVKKGCYNKIGDGYYDLSKHWYQNATEDGDKIKSLKSHLYSFFKRPENGAEGKLWTTFKDFREELTVKGAQKSFSFLNIKSTNEFSNTHNVAYTVNRFLHPAFMNYIRSQGAEINEDGFALSEMLQFIWRSAIRNGESINLYIPSRRMRILLELWVKDHCSDPDNYEVEKIYEAH